MPPPDSECQCVCECSCGHGHAGSLCLFSTCAPAHQCVSHRDRVCNLNTTTPAPYRPAMIRITWHPRLMLAERYVFLSFSRSRSLGPSRTFTLTLPHTPTRSHPRTHSHPPTHALKLTHPLRTQPRTPASHMPPPTSSPPALKVCLSRTALCSSRHTTRIRSVYFASHRPPSLGLCRVTRPAFARSRAVWGAYGGVGWR
eukprot:596190-Rhodomonas_salina.2